jgi:phytoene synthase
MPKPWSEQALGADDLAACRSLLRGGSRSFHAAAHLLPGRVRYPASALYAFCRLADDAIDVEQGAEEALVALRTRLDGVYGGCPEPIVADRALAAVVSAYGVPRALPEALLEGFAWDAAGRSYETFSDVVAYSARVAGTVGVMMALVMGVRSPHLLARAGDLGVAMQLTNIARDVGEDAAAGRLYLPRAWLREAGIDPDAWLARPAWTPALGAVVERLLAAAEDLYQRADAGIAGLPADCRPGIYAARLLYAGIGHELLRAGADSVARRTVVRPARKAQLLAGLHRVVALPTRDARAPVLPELRFLVEAVEAAPVPAFAAARPAERPARGFGRDFERVLELFERLEMRERALREQQQA